MYREVRIMKTTLLLATTLFLVTAPAPDAKGIAELTSNFIVPQNVPGLLAAEENLDVSQTSVTKKDSNTVSAEPTKRSD
ncbi:MAG: hypothetical protein ACI9CB_002731 [Rhodothermales bacterium]|jgi:hypothetical protein